MTGAYNVTVRFNDGCDDLTAHVPDLLERVESAADERDLGYAILEPEDESLLALSGHDRRLDERVHGAPEKRAHPASGPAGADHAARRPARAEEIRNATAAPHAVDKCTRAESKLDDVRGLHVAFHKLIMHYDDHCYGPIGASESAAISTCAATSRKWFRNRYARGETWPCWLFAHEERDADGDLEERVHVVLDRRLPVLVSLYLAYWAVVIALIVWQAVLCCRVCLQRRGVLAPLKLTPMPSEGVDMLRLGDVTPGAGGPDDRSFSQTSAADSQSSSAHRSASHKLFGSPRGPFRNMF